MTETGTTWRAARAGCDRVASVAIVGIVRVYQRLVSPLLGRHCRFEPSCSSYFVQSVEKHGAVHGSLRGLARICRCHPWHPGGYDPP